MIDRKSLKTLELDKILDRVSKFACTERGKQAILNTVPYETVEQCIRSLNFTQEAYNVMYFHGVYPTLAIDDISEALLIAEKLSMLSMGDLLRVAGVLRVSRNLKIAILKVDGSIPMLKNVCGELFAAQTLEQDITNAIISDTEMSDNASPALASIRRNIKKANDRLRDKLNSYIVSSEYSKYLQDNIVTMREDRYVIPVKAEARGQIQGLIHDRSASGQTVYIEPIAIVEMNNELRSLMIDEQKEIEKILRAFTLRVSEIVKELRRNYDIIVDLDVVFSKAIYSRDIKGIRPNIDANGIIDIRKGRHPLIDRSRVVPITLTLANDFDILLITGPNTGGKTVTLKMTGLFCLLGMCGIFISAEEDSTIGFYPQLFCDIGDEQSIEQNLSTFSSHVSNQVDILNRLDKKTLILLDELGAGTDPEEGASLAVAITDYIHKHGAKSVITTHYSPLKEYSYSTERVENACMDFDPDTFEPTYHLIIGVPGTSNALEIANRLGMKSEVIMNAKNGISREKQSFEEVLQSADMTRRRAEEQLEKYKQLSSELERKKEEYESAKKELTETKERLAVNARKEVKRLTENALIEVNSIMDELKTILDKPDQSSFFKAAKLRKKIDELNVEEDPESDKPEMVDETPQVGDAVFVLTLNATAILAEINKNGEYLIKFGGIKTRVRKKDIKKLKKQPEPKKENIYQKKTPASRGLINPKIETEINLIGQTCDEAIYNLEQFLDKCALTGVKEVRIIHGKGTGKLRSAVWDFLKECNIIDYRLGKTGEGAEGVTIATLSK